MATVPRIAGNKFVSHVVKNGIAVVKLNMPDSKHNLLDEKSTSELLGTFHKILGDQEVRGAVMMSGKPTSFIAGADTKMLGTWETAEKAEYFLRSVKQEFSKLEKSEKPIVAAIMGPCMGAGLELAMACHWRIAVAEPKTKIALPEVKLGLLPAAGGTQRMIKLLPIRKALEMLLTGKSVGAEEAMEMGLVDQVLSLCPDDEEGDVLVNTHKRLEDVAIETALGICSGEIDPKKREGLWSTWERVQNYCLTKIPLLRSVFFSWMERKADQQSGGHPAPKRIIDCVWKGLTEGEDAGYELETKHFGELLERLVSGQGVSANPKEGVMPAT